MKNTKKNLNEKNMAFSTNLSILNRFKVQSYYYTRIAVV